MAKGKDIAPMQGEETIWRFNQLHNWICCDCGLVHTVHLQSKGMRGVSVMMWRNEYLTKEERTKKRSKHGKGR